MMLNILGDSSHASENIHHGKLYEGGHFPGDYASKTIPGDPKITELWMEYVNPNINTTTWEFKKRVFDQAVRLFSSQRNWFQFQERNPSLHGNNYEFVVDTLRFILTGRRHLSIHSWAELVSHEHTQQKDVSRRNQLSDFLKHHASSLRNPPFGMLQKWCSHPEGFDDMVCTLNLLFGDLSVR